MQWETTNAKGNKMKIYRTKSKAVEGIDIVNAEMANGRLITFTVF